MNDDAVATATVMLYETNMDNGFVPDCKLEVIADKTGLDLERVKDISRVVQSKGRTSTPVNVNSMVRVKLTPSGADTLCRNPLVHYPSGTGFVETGLVETELWMLMKIFGNSIWMGANPFVNNTIEILNY